MRKIIDYIRSCFCKHEWELICINDVFGEDWRGEPTKMPLYRKWVYVCKKCCSRKVITNKK